MGWLIKNHLGLSAVKISDGRVVEAWPTLMFMLGWVDTYVIMFCRQKEWTLDIPKPRTYQKSKRKRG